MLDTAAILRYLHVDAATPDKLTLDGLIAAYARTVPWETCSRIVRRHGYKREAECANWPETFWQQAIEFGRGGTCFESNLAFKQLLDSVGYDCYLTVNNMADRVGCHTAIVVRFGAEKWLVDAGYPLYAPLQFRPNAPTSRHTPFHTYITRPDGDHIWQIERDKHPSPNIFTLINRPIAEADYRQALVNDYRYQSGLFLDQLVINKVVDGVAWRYAHREMAGYLLRFENGERTTIAINGTLSEAIAGKFAIDRGTVSHALTLLKIDDSVRQIIY